jgi:SpoVK/Ycf46/Vps4 family AAA+-type ATPase
MAEQIETAEVASANALMKTLDRLRRGPYNVVHKRQAYSLNDPNLKDGALREAVRFAVAELNALLKNASS